MAVASFWTIEEVDLSQDMRDWNGLSGAATSVITRDQAIDATKMPVGG